MKTFRFFIVAIVVALVMSVWAPAPVSAQGVAPTDSTQSILTAKVKVASLIVDNRTGGSLYVRLAGPVKSYWFVASKSGKTTFTNIQPGRYVITVTTSACGGSLTIKKNFNGKVKLKPFICRR